jgi:hypothetical protein
VRIAKRLDPLAKLTFVANTDAELLPAGVTAETVESTVVVSDAAKRHTWTRGKALTEGLRAIPYGVGLARLLELPGISSLLDVAYDFVASRRRSWSEGLGYAACGVPQKLGGAVLDDPTIERPPLFGKWPARLSVLVTLVFAVALASQMIMENRRVPQWMKDTFKQPPVLAAIAQYPRFYQGWSMFAPVPPMDDGRVVVDAVTVDGRHIDPLTWGNAPDFELPGPKEGMLMTQFWYEFHDRERRDQNARYRDHLRDYLVNWHTIEGRPANDKIVSFEAFWVWRSTQPPYSRQRMPTQKQRFMDWSAEPGPAAVGPPAPPASGRPAFAAPPGASGKPGIRLPLVPPATGH